MPFRTSRTISMKHMLFSRRSGSAVLLIILACMLGLAASAQFVRAAGPSDLGLEANIVRMNFHMYGSIYRNSNSSVFIYNGADTNPPTYATAPNTLVSCAVHQSAQIWFTGVDAWLGGTSWITQPLSEDMTIQGNVSMTVWMSTPDPAPIASGYAFGLTEVDNTGNPIGNQFYQYKYGYGNILNQSPASFTLVFGVNRTFVKGNILGFFVIVGSATKEWHYQVHFDSPAMNSFAELPAMSVPVPEFSRVGAVACMTLVMVALCAIRRRKNWALVAPGVSR
jgi:hypothetical protein